MFAGQRMDDSLGARRRFAQWPVGVDIYVAGVYFLWIPNQKRFGGHLTWYTFLVELQCKSKNRCKLVSNAQGQF